VLQPGGGPVALLTDAECWKRMPTLSAGGGQPLPNWVKAVATRLPRTAAAMLELDLAQRIKSPLDPSLRAKMRWVIAHANRCAYSLLQCQSAIDYVSFVFGSTHVSNNHFGTSGSRSLSKREVLCSQATRL